jgi:hypothetical protein
VRRLGLKSETLCVEHVGGDDLSTLDLRTAGISGRSSETAYFERIASHPAGTAGNSCRRFPLSPSSSLETMITPIVTPEVSNGTRTIKKNTSATNRLLL